MPEEVRTAVAQEIPPEVVAQAILYRVVMTEASVVAAVGTDQILKSHGSIHWTSADLK